MLTGRMCINHLLFRQIWVKYCEMQIYIIWMGSQKLKNKKNQPNKQKKDRSIDTIWLRESFLM